MMQRDWEVKVSHGFREQNRAADHMARRALNHERGLRVFDRPPNDMEKCLELDAKGAPVAKRVEVNNH